MKKLYMKISLILLAVTILLFGGCIEQTTNQKTVKIGDNVSVDYTGSSNGKVFDTSIESVAKENNLSIPNRTYKPLRFIVGKGRVIKGFEEGIVGMKVGESKTLTIPSEKAYGPKDPKLVQIIPVVQNFSTTRTFPKLLDTPIDQFGQIFGADHKIGDNVQIPGSEINLTIQDITTSSVSLSYNLKVGDEISRLAPWNETVMKIDDKNITTKSEAKKNDIIKLPGAIWNSTIIDINSENITLRHNSIPDTKTQIARSIMKVHFNDTYVTLDANDELAGDTLIFNVTIKSID